MPILVFSNNSSSCCSYFLLFLHLHGGHICASDHWLLGIDDPVLWDTIKTGLWDGSLDSIFHNIRLLKGPYVLGDEHVLVESERCHFCLSLIGDSNSHSIIAFVLGSLNWLEKEPVIEVGLQLNVIFWQVQHQVAMQFSDFWILLVVLVVDHDV